MLSQPVQYVLNILQIQTAILSVGNPPIRCLLLNFDGRFNRTRDLVAAVRESFLCSSLWMTDRLTDEYGFISGGSNSPNLILV